jgi:hypothetical protein
VLGENRPFADEVNGVHYYDKLIFFCVLFTALPARADLYRWIDPETRAIKYSSYPPPWAGDAERERRSPPVEVLRYTPRGAARTPEGDKAIAPLEERRRRLLQELLALPERRDRGPDEIQRQLQAYQLLAYELDRLDPKGAPARKAEDYEVMEKLRRRLEGNAR